MGICYKQPIPLSVEEKVLLMNLFGFLFDEHLDSGDSEQR